MSEEEMLDVLERVMQKIPLVCSRDMYNKLEKKINPNGNNSPDWYMNKIYQYPNYPNDMIKLLDGWEVEEFIAIENLERYLELLEFT